MVPSRKHINKLIVRNEHLIATNHPIKNKLVSQLGKMFKQRKKYLENVYYDTMKVIPYAWDGIKGYNPETDEFYKTIIRSLIK